jgi:hypothetical protein
MAFDTEVPMEEIPYEKRSLLEGIYRQEYFNGKQTSWIPVETTFIQEGFESAWQQASEELQQRITSVNEAEELAYNPVLLGDAWEIYPPVNVPYDVKKIQRQVLDKVKQVIELKEDAIMQQDIEAIQWFTFQP